MHMKCSCGMQGGLLVEFENNAGHSVLLMKAGSLPTLATADFTFRSKEFTKGDQVFHPLESAVHIHLPLISALLKLACKVLISYF